MHDVFIFAAIVLVCVLGAVVSFSRLRKRGEIVYYLRSRFASQAKISNYRFNFVYDSFPIEIGLGKEGRYSYLLRVVLTGKFPKQKLFMYKYPLVAKEVCWEKNKLTSSFPESEMDSEDTLYDSIIARLEVMVNVARELEAKNVNKEFS